ncbi:DnaJ domain-containing protein [Bombella sp. TMW 2.2559]|uniref:DnaJ domain-containing protein n=1 Tax=Bombella dulcis TaxID=2967339 RepID=A0ABT3WBM0_9PROT|nr:peptidoglycan-binding protein [Bombella dulcis]MCX5616475.1 DnaJ domain-containing protein [Bombella dulcis]
MLDQAYYALRHQSPVYLHSQLKAELVRDLEPVQDCFPADGIYGESLAACYQRIVGQLADRYRARLTGRAHEEAVRPIDAHIVLQKRLRDLGYLSSSLTPDGVYGETTREGILRWQEKMARPHQDGFLGDGDAGMLMSGPVAASFPTDGEAGAERDVPSGQEETMRSPEGDPSQGQGVADVVHSVLESLVHLWNVALHVAGADLAALWKLILPFLLMPLRLAGVFGDIVEALFSMKLLLVPVVGLLFYLRLRARMNGKVGFSSAREKDCYEKVGMLWAGWVRELDIAGGETLLELLVERRLRSAFQFLKSLVRPIKSGTSRTVLEELGRGQTWQDFYRCSVHVHGLLQQVAKAGEARTRRQQDQKRAEEAETERRRQEQARRQNQQRSGSSSGGSGSRAWHVVLEVSEKASREEIILAYRRLIKQHHPDRFAHVGGAAYEKAVRRTAEITQAFQYVKQYRRF